MPIDHRKLDARIASTATKLVACPACAKAVSRSAPACPQCGEPMAPITIERTGKTAKLMQLIGSTACMVAVLIFGLESVIERAHVTSGFMLAVGLSVFVAGRIQAWWRNG